MIQCDPHRIVGTGYIAGCLQRHESLCVDGVVEKPAGDGSSSSSTPQLPRLLGDGGRCQVEGSTWSATRVDRVRKPPKLQPLGININTQWPLLSPAPESHPLVIQLWELFSE